jgi:hypothetical protein
MIQKECFNKEWIDKAGNAADVKDMTISPVISKEVAKIRRGNPEAFYYWSKISEMLSQQA